MAAVKSFNHGKKSIFRRMLSLGLYLLGILFVFVFIVVILYWQTDILGNTIKNYLNAQMKDGAKIEYSGLRGNLINTIEITDFDITFKNNLRIKTSYVELEYGLIGLLFGKIEVSAFHTDNLSITLPEIIPAAEPGTGDESQHFVFSEIIRNRKTYLDSLFNILPDVLINDVRINASQIHIEGSPFTIRDVILKIGRLAANKNKIEFKLNRLQAYWMEKDLQLENFSFNLISKRDFLKIDQFSFATKYSRASLGLFVRFDKNEDLLLDISELYLDFGEFRSLIPPDISSEGHILGKVQLNGVSNRYKLNTSLSGIWRELILQRLNADLEYDDGNLNVNNLKLKSNAGEIAAAGHWNKRGGAAGRLHLKQFQLHKLPGQNLPTFINGKMSFDLKNYRWPNISGSGALHIYKTQIDSIPIDTLLLAVQASNGKFKVDRPSFLTLASGSRFDLEGFIKNLDEIDLTLTTFDNDLSVLTKALKMEGIAGIFDGRFRAVGKMDNPDVSGNLDINRFKMNTVEFDSVQLNLYLQEIISGRRGEALFHVHSGNIGDMPLSDARVEAEFDSNEVHISHIDFRSDSNYIETTMDIVFQNDKTFIEAPFLKLVYGDYWLENESPVAAQIDSGGVTIEDFRLRGPGSSRLEMDGFWENKANDMQIYLTLKSVELEPFNQFWDESFNIGGKVNGTAELVTPLHNSNLDMELNVENLVYNNTDLGNVYSRFQYANDVFYLNEFGLSRDSSKLTASGDLAFQIDESKPIGLDILDETKANFKLNWRNIMLGQFAPLFLDKNDRLQGRASGYLEIGGSVNRPVFRQHLRLDKFSFNKLTVDSLDMFGQYNSGYLILDSLAAVLNGTQFEMKGWQKYNLVLTDIDTLLYDKPFKLFISSRGDQINFIRHFNDQIETFKGAYELELHAGGTLRKPAISHGYFRADNAELIVSQVTDPIRNLIIDAEIEDSVLTLRECNGFAPKEKDFLERSMAFINGLFPWTEEDTEEGALKVAGKIGLTNLMRPQMDLKITMNDFFINDYINNTQLLLSSDSVSITGRDTILISGGIDILHGNYEVDMKKLESQIYLTDTKLTTTPPYIAMNLDIKIPGSFIISSSPSDFLNNYKITIIGNLHTAREARSEALLISGHLEVASGNYASWNQNFKVESGTIDFNDPFKINPDINIVAVKRLGERIFELTISGTPEKLRQSVRVLENGREIDMSLQDKITLLTFGVDTRQMQANTDSTLRSLGEEVLTTSLLTAVERGAEQVSGLDKVKIDTDESLFDFKKGKLNSGFEDASISFGKYLSSDLYIEYRTRFGGEIPAPKLSWEAGNRIQLEYRLNRSWFINSFYEKTNTGSDKIKIGLGWEYTY